MTTIETQAARLERLRKETGLTKYKLAKLSGVSRPMIILIESGKRDLKYGIAQKLAPHLKATPLYLMCEEESREDTAKNTIAEIKEMLRLAKEKDVETISEMLQIPIRGLIPCGIPFPEEQQDGETVGVPRERLGILATRKDLYALRVSGDSLEGDGIHKGQYVVIEPNAPLVNGAIYIVRLGNSVVARHVEKTEGKIRLRASNDHYQDLEPSEVELLGKIITWGGWQN
jgi:repressor LexA